MDDSDLTYDNWAEPPSIVNRQSLDCVKYASDGWRVHDDFCAVAELPFVCEMNGKVRISSNIN